MLEAQGLLLLIALKVSLLFAAIGLLLLGLQSLFPIWLRLMPLATAPLVFWLSLVTPNALIEISTCKSPNVRHTP
jgi:hypothetical protein